MRLFQKWVESRYSSFTLPILSAIALLIVWEVGVRVLQIRTFILPAPSAILGELNTWGDTVFKHSLQTLWTTTMGFVLAIGAGILLGFLIGYSKFAYKSLYPLLVGFNTIPKVALVPLLALWFRIGATPAIITAFLLAFFPIAVNVAVGLATVEPEMQDVLRSLGATQWEIFQKVGLPHSLPYLFASLKVAISLAFVGSVISETVASNAGLGYLIVSATSTFDVPLAFLGLSILGLMGILLYSVCLLLEVYWIPWQR
ncbi:MAG: ABC transporter permease [Desertifilum sp.]|nr:ABC transporter permease [Desertifilum sp.]